MQSHIVSKFIDAVKTYGPKTTVVDSPGGQGLRRTSYDALMARARQVAACIQEQGTAPQSFVTIELPAGADFLAAEMGVWMSRCVSVPVGTAFPEVRKRYIRQHCEAALNIDAKLMESIALNAPMADVRMPDGTDDALLVYTSGSTGTPKGILNDHRSAATNGLKMFEAYDLTPNDRFAAGPPSYFAAAIFYWILVQGVEVHILPPEITKDVAAMAEYHRRNNITIAFVSATVYPVYRCTATSMRTVFTGSDRVICRSKPGYRLENIYGLSETMGAVVHTTITEPTENAPIGLPIPGVEFAILDDDLRPVPQGEEGEICLKGHFCKGYFKDEERTRELYRGGWLHTGDLGYVLEDGRIQFVNRKDWMVKVNGQRVEPGEVEAAMCSVGGVSRAVVKGFQRSDSGSQYLVGYYTLQPGGDTSETLLREELGRTLPSYMVPAMLVRLESFPLNANGKIDRISLKAPERNSLTAEYTAPRNEMEAALCEAMAKAMGLPRVGIDDDFRRLGGDSIQMMNMQQLCSDSPLAELHAISTAIIYQGATPRRMAEMLSEALPKEKPQMDDYPLGEMQKDYFQVCSANPDVPAGNIPALYKIPGQIDINRLKKAIETAVNSHEAFHTRLFTGDDGQPRQKIVHDTFRLSEEPIPAAEFEALKGKLIQPFPMIDERLFRIRLFDAEGTYYLFIDVNHIIFDGTSRIIFYRDIDRAYAGLGIEPEDWTQAQLAAEEYGLRRSGAFERDRNHFLRTFDKDALIKPLTGEEKGCARIPLGISCREAEAFCRRQGITINALTTAAYMLVLGKYAHTEDVTILTAYSGRDDARAKNTVGYLARNIPVRAQWTADMPTAEFARQVGQSLLNAMAHSLFSFPDIVREWNAFPAYQFICQGDLGGDFTVDGCIFEEIPFERNPNPLFDAQLFFDRAADGLVIVITAPCAEAYIQRWAAHYAACLKGLMSAPAVGQATPKFPSI